VRDQQNKLLYVLEVTKICVVDDQIVSQRPVMTFTDECEHYTALVI